METAALYLATRDPRVPWYAKVVAGCVVAYAFSPIDLIPDFIPVLGVLDDLLILPAGIFLARRMIPPEILREHRQAASRRIQEAAGRKWIGILLVAAVWAVLAGAGLAFAFYIWPA